MKYVIFLRDMSSIIAGKNTKKLRDWDEVPNSEKIQIYKEIKQQFLKEMEKKEISVKEENLADILGGLE